MRFVPSVFLSLTEFAGIMMVGVSLPDCISNSFYSNDLEKNQIVSRGKVAIL